MDVFIYSLIMVFLAEMADKTQFLVAALTSKYKVRDIIIGMTLSILLLNLLSVLVGGAISNFFPEQLFSLIAGLLFLFFALFGMGGKKEESSAPTGKRGKGVVLAIAGAFFVAELADKTQLAAVTLAASYPDNAGGVFWGATVGLLGADLIGLLAGVLLGKKLPEEVMQVLSFLVFTVFGFLKLYRPCMVYFGNAGAYVLIGIALLFAFCTCMLLRNKLIETGKR